MAVVTEMGHRPDLAHLLHEHRHVLTDTAGHDVADPFLVQRPGTGTGLTTDDDPVDTSQVEVAETAFAVRPGARHLLWLLCWHKTRRAVDGRATLARGEHIAAAAQPLVHV